MIIPFSSTFQFLNGECLLLLVHQEGEHVILQPEDASNDATALPYDLQSPESVKVAALPKILYLGPHQLQHQPQSLFLLVRLGELPLLTFTSSLSHHQLSFQSHLPSPLLARAILKPSSIQCICDRIR